MNHEKISFYKMKNENEKMK